MARKSEFRLQQFKTFLESLGLKAATIAIYASRVRAAFRHAAPGELPRAEDVARAMQETDPRQFRCAWLHFAAYLKTKGYEAAPLPPDPSNDARLDDPWTASRGAPADMARTPLRKHRARSSAR